MPSFTLGVLNATTDPVPAGCNSLSASVSGTFIGTVTMERRPTPNSAWETMARDNAGVAVSFAALSGAFPIWVVEGEPDAEVRARMSAFTSGSAAVRIGR